MEVYFSPHLADAVVSCGGSIARSTFAEQPAEVKVCTVMAGDPDPGFTKSALVQRYHAQFGVTNKPVQTRRQEDTLACNALKATVEYLSTSEAIYRQDGSGNFLYTVDDYDFPNSIYGQVADYDVVNTLPAIIKNIETAFPDPSTITRVFAPLGIGLHVDHQLTRQAVELWAAKASIPVVYYEEYPACKYVRTPSIDLVKEMKLQKVPCDLSKKLDAVIFYKTQFRELAGPGAESKDVQDQLSLYLALCNNVEFQWA